MTISALGGHADPGAPAPGRYARYVGRVGILAVALGVFGAVASPGAGWAEAETSTADASSTSSSDTGSPDSGASSDTTSDDAADTDTTDSDDAGKDEAEDDDTLDEGATEEESVEEEPAEEDGPDDEASEDDSDEVAEDDAEVGQEPAESTEPVEESASDPTEEPVEEQAATEAEPVSEDVEAQQDAPVAEITPFHATTAQRATTNLLEDWGKQIGTALGLPTPAQVQERINAAVVQCLCSAITGIQQFFSNQMSSGTTDSPANPLQNTVLWTALAWARRQIDFAVAAFNRSPIGQTITMINNRVNDWLDTEVYNSPWGREISATVGAFLQSCADSTALPEEFDRTVVVSGLNEPTDFDFIMDPDDPDHIHAIVIAEKSGAIKVYDMHTGVVTTVLKLNVVTAGGERGLIGIEVDPNFWAEGEAGYRTVYAAYTGADNYDRLSSFVMSPSLTELGSETLLVKSTEQANDFHHGGELEFDPTGQYLYWAVGNNTRPSENSQDLTNIHGKILRLNRDGSAAAGNPFITDSNEITQRIYAYGLRNPFRFGFDPDTGALLAGDVGEGSWEELNLIVAGANYGWPAAEGPCDNCGYVNPLYAYPHAQPTNSGSITSVLVLDDDSTPAGQRKVLIADYSLGWIRELTFDDEYSSLISERTFDSAAGAAVKLTQAPNGDIYQLNIYPGVLSVIAPSGGNRSPVAVIEASTTSGAGNQLQVDFSAGQSSDPDGDPLTYRWDFGNGQTSTVADPTVVFTNSGTYTAYTVTLTVSDGEKQNVTTQRIVVGSTPPAADFEVTSPGGYNYNAGDTVTFRAEADDVQDGTLPASAYTWTVEFHHADHKHPFLADITGPDLSFRVPTDYDQLANTYYKVILTVTDSSGLTTTTVKDVRPNLVTLTFGANDPEARYTIDGIPHTGTYSEQSVVGVTRTLGAISPQTIGGQQMVFGSWSDGGAATHTVVVPGSDTSYTVNYVPSAL